MQYTALARLIMALGSFNNYRSTAYQTKLALAHHSTAYLCQTETDIAIFTDALKGIAAIQKIGFNTQSIIAVNRVFDSPAKIQPTAPGRLRNAQIHTDDKIVIPLGSRTKIAYYPPAVITPQDLEVIVTQYQHSPQQERDAWRVFAQLAKLQPFQDGNKRTALIATNAAFDTLKSGDYLILPTNDLDLADFMIGLMRYYAATDTTGENQALARMLQLLPSAAERHQELTKPITSEKPLDPKTIRIKP
ncbi:hypothetical protein FC83_GL003336 [Agrilactobacillus composti DSM 18527 = JCM 14202]|uniref:Fido domain-containing protein n=1 Tax=Agrilactobacillus composti DSM 18527 = JCM 14202 TaxID=1423734 RepID=X0QNW2_9LACO|nr:Fic family protein [Agrilactobacillus composti]KRM33252.1 hypothetical protein FC83_GL003336 [Agrilactobacillus composti DSM 18527 = JCM 14202]GAF40325.1 hypothetical protein JCM14202_2219 [Agrilactobacillus composti DSM 18527 = JCM 14202]